MKTRNLLYIVPFLVMVACQPTIDEFVPSKGSSFFFSVPRGKHNYQIKILEPGQTALLRILIPRKDLKQ